MGRGRMIEWCDEMRWGAETGRKTAPNFYCKFSEKVRSKFLKFVCDGGSTF